jgi:hypothetical protein
MTRAFAAATCALFLATWGGYYALAGSSAEWLEGTLENWQSEFLQVFWSVAGAAACVKLFGAQKGDTADKADVADLRRRIDEMARRMGRP